MSKIYETTIELNAALGRQYAQTFAAAQKLTNGLDSSLVEMQTNAANMSGLAGLGQEIQSLSQEMAAANGGTDEQKNQLKYLQNEYQNLSMSLNGSVLLFNEIAQAAKESTDAFEEQEIAAKDLAQTQQAMEDVKGVIKQRKEVERLKELYESMPNKQLKKDLKEQEKALKRLESQTGLTGRTMEQLENREKLLIKRNHEIVASQDAVNRSMKKAEAWNKFKQNASKAFGGAQKAAGTFGTAIKTLGGGVGIALGAITAAVGAVGAAFGVLANETGQKLADTEQRARQFGMDTDMFQGMEYSMKKNGVERDQYIDGLQTLQERMVEAAKEPGEMRDNFAKMGITLDDLKSKNVGEVFKQMAGNAHMLGTEAEQTKMGLDMLGGEGGKIMAAMAKDGIAGIEKDFDEAKRMGAIATQEQINNALKYQESVAKMGAAWDGVKQTVGAAVMPVLTKGMEFISKWLDDNPELIQNLGRIIENVINTSVDMFNEYVLPVFEKFKAVIKKLEPLFPILVEVVKFAFILIMSYVNMALDLIGSVIDFVKDAYNTIVKYLGKAKETFNSISESIVSTWQWCVDGIAAGIDWIVEGFLSIPDKISSLGDSIGNFFDGIWSDIKATFVSMLNWVIGKINGISFTVPDWVPDIGGQTIGANIPMLASGGIATKPTPAIIAEGGEPEAVLPLSKLEGLLSGGGSMGGVSLTITQNISLSGGGDVEEQAKRGAAAGAQDLASQIDAIMKRKYRLAM